MRRTRILQSSSILHHFRSPRPSLMATTIVSPLLLQGNTNNLSPSTLGAPSSKMHIFLHALHSHTNYSIPKVSTASIGRRRRRRRRRTECCYDHPTHPSWPENYHHCRGNEGDNNNNNNNSSSSSSSSSRNKARAFAPSLFRQLSCDSTEDAPGKLVNHDHHSNSPIGFHDQSYSEKVVVAVDVDEVLGNFLSALNMFIADRYSSKHSVSDYHVYEFFKIWNCTRDEADIRVHEFFKTSYFKSGIHPIPGARQTLQKLSRFCNLSVVTSRQNAIKDQTIEWIDKHYPGLFQEIQFGNHFSLEGQSRPKSDICRSLGAKILIDDNPRYAAECAEAGMMVLLFDYDNSYPWSKTGSVSQHPLVTKVHNWKEVENELLTWFVSEKL